MRAKRRCTRVHERIEQLRTVADDEDRDLEDALPRSADRFHGGGQVAEGLLGLREVILAGQLPVGGEPDLAADEDDPRPPCDRDVTVGGPLEKPIGVDQLDCH